MGKSLFYNWSLCAVQIATLLLMACGSENPSPQRAANDTAQVNAASTVVDSSGNDGTIADWLSDRYGPASGVIEYQVVSGGQKSSQTWYFKDHGMREARYWKLDDSPHPAVHITIIDSGNVLLKGPGDPKPVRSAWRPDPNTALPNFQHLTPQMRQMFSVGELPAKTVLGKECSGYRLKIGETISDVWVWEGVMLYGEIQGAADRKIEPIVMRATSLQADADVPEEKFRIADQNR